MSRLLLGFIVLTALLAGDDSAADPQKQRLSKLQALVGKWRGVGQPQRNSSKDSWTEEADWAWSFGGDGPALTAKLPKGKYFNQFRLSASAADDQYQLTATPAAGGEPVKYTGRLDDQEQLVLTPRQPREGLPHRLSFRFTANGARLILLMEKQSATNGPFTRLAEVGYTREGSGFGKNLAQRECVVTGGLGTIEVTHNGQTHFVCCTGCRDYFNENPEKVLAEYKAKKK